MNAKTPIWGEVSAAFAVLRPGAGELPKTATGKIQKFALRDRLWAGRDRRVN